MGPSTDFVYRPVSGSMSIRYMKAIGSSAAKLALGIQ
ncbi:hypothetical protein F383_28588 [Gossypium arboreum]|uniref:Uncharacterized protein n=1 Tax=Gossypium arboreum TaxID=29729 RepID=A0A0B0MWS2_GOSAR|nr:hypothetical protein F383_28588 [Gossypium arboreum]